MFYKRYTTCRRIIVRLLSALIVALLAATSVYAQVTEEQADIKSTSLSFGLDAEVGILSFENDAGDGERFLSSVLAPSIERGLWSGGLRLRYRWNQSGMRDEDYDEASDFLAIIRFVQYSEKYADGYYGRLGDIDRSQLGYGQFINQYRNTLSLDEPKTGFLLDRNDTRYQIEGLFSNLASPEVYGIRAAYQPFRADTSRSIHRMSLGFTLAGDMSDEARLINPHRNGLPFVDGPALIAADTLGIGSVYEASPLTMIGVDVSMTIPTERVDSLVAYAELGQIFGFGAGLGVGVTADHQFGDIRLKGWFEQRVLGREYVPSYFNSRYEYDRIRSTTVTLADRTEVDALNSKRNELYRRDVMELGSYLGMELRYTRHYRLRWSLEHSWTRDQSGWFQLDVRVTDPDLPVQFRYVFDQVNMDDLGDILSGPPENGLHRLEVAYMIVDHVLIGLRLRQSFETIENLGRTVGNKKRTRFEPAIVIRI